MLTRFYTAHHDAERECWRGFAVSVLARMQPMR
jgi:hypothetical protein